MSDFTRLSFTSVKYAPHYSAFDSAVDSAVIQPSIQINDRIAPRFSPVLYIGILSNTQINICCIEFNALSNGISLRDNCVSVRGNLDC